MRSPLAGFAGFASPGPVAAAFMADRTTFVRAILGPQGGGKSVSCIFDLLANASAMPVCRDGRIRFRVAVIRDTYGNLEKNLYPTWFSWLPKEGSEWVEGEWAGGSGRYGSHKLYWQVLRNGRPVQVEFEAVFAAIGEQAAEPFMRGFEVSAFWLNEVDLLPEDVLTYGIGRVGRYPRKSDLPDGAEFRRYLIADLNAPDIDSWFYRRFEEDRLEGHKLYRQPSGRGQKAENIQNLPRGYYATQVTLNASKPWWIRRMVDAEYGPSLIGEPVYGEYSDQLHMAGEPLVALKGRPVYLGFDQGLRNPACIVFQVAPSGQYRVLSEVVPGRMSARRFAELVKRDLADVAPGLPVAGAWADPAGFAGADKEDDELAWAESVSAALGLPVMPAPSNELGLRHDAVRDELTYMVDGNTPALLVSPRCRMLRKGFASHYIFDKKPDEKGQARSPIKNLWSNPHDALQYGLLGHKGPRQVITGDRPRGGDGRVRPAFVAKSPRVDLFRGRP